MRILHDAGRKAWPDYYVSDKEIVLSPQKAAETTQQ